MQIANAEAKCTIVYVKIFMNSIGNDTLRIILCFGFFVSRKPKGFFFFFFLCVNASSLVDKKKENDLCNMFCD